MQRFWLQQFAIVFLLCSADAFASDYVYQINSETLNLPNIEGTQSDLKLLAGLNFNSKARASIGIHSLHQSAKDPSYYLRYGPVLQLRAQIIVPNLFFVYEHHEYNLRSSYLESAGLTTNKFWSENRYGIFYSRYDALTETLFFDSYFETFLIPEVSKSDLLTVFRTTLLYKEFFASPFLELYTKDSPRNFGGKATEVRIGAQWQPYESISLKIMGNILPRSESSSSGLLFQLNIFKEGSI